MVTPSFPDQELDTRRSTQVIYWEGSVHVRGTYAGQPVAGHGYVELTGYAGRFNKRI
jgi:predicted secreted hydrolase